MPMNRALSTLASVIQWLEQPAVLLRRTDGRVLAGNEAAQRQFGPAVAVGASCEVAGFEGDDDGFAQLTVGERLQVRRCRASEAAFAVQAAAEEVGC